MNRVDIVGLIIFHDCHGASMKRCQYVSMSFESGSSTSSFYRTQVIRSGRIECVPGDGKRCLPVLGFRATLHYVMCGLQNPSDLATIFWGKDGSLFPRRQKDWIENLALGWPCHLQRICEERDRIPVTPKLGFGLGIS